ncbi:hypothetical protein HQQ80_03875 [Microbacteriaceae bacterium VKM Ac-2855]|nr:hypothetical protein [Microbacteriaceae bacterium VKM Ac-2855]
MRHRSRILASGLIAPVLVAAVLAPPADAAAVIVPVVGDIAVDTTWGAGNVFLIEHDLAVLEGATLTIEPGAVVKVSPVITLSVLGTVSASGTAAAATIITSSRDDTAGGDTDGPGGAPERGEWGGFVLEESGVATFDAVEVRYGSIGTSNAVNTGRLQVVDSVVAQSISGITFTGENIEVRDSSIDAGLVGFSTSDSSDPADGLRFEGNTVDGGPLLAVGGGSSADAVQPVVRDNHVTGVVGYALPLQYGASRLLPSDVTGNTAVGNDVNAIGLAGTLQEDWTITGDEPLPVLLGTTGNAFGGLRVGAGHTLTLEPGAVLKPAASGSIEDPGARLAVDGTLEVLGTENEPATLTSQWDDEIGVAASGGGITEPSVDDWGGVTVFAGGTARFEHAQLNNAGLQAFGSLTMTDSVVTQTAFGIEADGPGSTIVRRSGIDGGLAAHPFAPYDQSVAAAIELTDNEVQRGQLIAAAGTDPTVAFTVMGNRVTGALIDGTADPSLPYAIVLSSPRLRPIAFAGNSAEGTGSDAIALNGTLVSDWSVPASGPAYAITPYGADRPGLTVARSATLTLRPGVVLKVGTAGDQEGAFDVAGRLAVVAAPARPVIVTSTFDDAVGVPIDPSDRGPAVSDWAGIRVTGTGVIAAAGLSLRYTDGTPLTTRSTLLGVAKPSCGYLLAAGRATARCF